MNDEDEARHFLACSWPWTTVELREKWLDFLGDSRLNEEDKRKVCEVFLVVRVSGGNNKNLEHAHGKDQFSVVCMEFTWEMSWGVGTDGS